MTTKFNMMSSVCKVRFIVRENSIMVTRINSIGYIFCLELEKHIEDIASACIKTQLFSKYHLKRIWYTYLILEDKTHNFNGKYSCYCTGMYSRCDITL